MRRHLAALLFSTTLLATAACGPAAPSQSTPGQPDDVTLGLISILDVAPSYLGKEKGFFSARNINLTLAPAQGGVATIPAVLSGQQQFGFSNIVTLLLAQVEGLPIKVVSNGVNSTGMDGADFAALMVKGDSPIRTVSDLAGKKVAVNLLKNVAEVAVSASLRKAGVDPNTVTYVELGFPEQPPALQDGRVDAVFVVEPFQQIVLAQGGRKLASSFVDVAPDLPVAMYFTSTKLIGENPDLVRRFTEAMQESLAYADAHPAEARSIITTYTQVSPDLIDKLTLPKWPADVNRQSVQTMADVTLREGVLSKPADPAVLLP